jgi:hypothetical protein
VEELSGGCEAGWGARIAERKVPRGSRDSARENERGFGQDRRGQDGRIDLKLRGLLALGEMRAISVPGVFIEQVVDEVRRKSD